MILVTLLVSLAILQAPSAERLGQYVPQVPTPASFISDSRSVLSPEQRASLDARIRTVQSAGLGDIAVAILPSIGDYSPNQVSVAIYRSWKVGSMANIGSAHRDMGMLILIVPKELSPNKKGECWINTGNGAEGIVTDAIAGTICRDAIIPKLKTRDYAGALASGIDALETRLRGDAALANPAKRGEILSPPPAERARAEGSSNRFRDWLLLGGIISLVAALFGVKRWRRYRVRRCPRCDKPMRRLGEDADDALLESGQLIEERIKSVDYDVWECSCGEHLVLAYRALITSYSNCRQCGRRAVASDRKVLFPATTMSSGLAEDRYRCEACAANWTVQAILPMIVLTTSSSGGSGGGGAGGGGGSSFGGSGATSGGGGGGSY